MVAASKIASAWDNGLRCPNRSSHKSPRYGKHYTVEEIHDIFSPSEESVDAVRAWLESAGIAPERVSQSVNKQWLQFDADAEEVENLLQTKYYVYSHSMTGKSHVATDEYVSPRQLFPDVMWLMVQSDTMSRKRSASTLITSPPGSSCSRSAARGRPSMRSAASRTPSPR